MVNNIGDPAFVYENKSPKSQHWLRIKLIGPATNPLGIGAKVLVYQDSMGVQINDFTLSRGYLSSVEPYIHFGLGERNAIDSLIVIWQDAKKTKLTNLSLIHI